MKAGSASRDRPLSCLPARVFVCVTRLLPRAAPGGRGWLAGLLLLLLPASAFGHALHVLRGEALVGPESLSMELAVPRENLRHYAERLSGGRSAEATLEHFRARIAGGLVLRDAAGRVLPLRASATRWDADVGLISLDYPTADGLLVLRYTPAEVGNVREQLLLTCTTQASGPAVTLRLTSGGNPGYLQFESGDGARRLVRDRSALRTCAAYEAQQPARWSQIVLTTDRREPGLLTVTVPLHLLDTWGWLPHEDADFVSSAEFEHARDRCAGELATALGMKPDETDAPLPAVGLTGARTDGRTSVWTGVLQVRIEGPPGATVRVALFNARVQQIAHVKRDAEECVVRTLNSYARDVTLPG